jgi:hypothetical protein
MVNKFNIQSKALSVITLWDVQKVGRCQQDINNNSEHVPDLGKINNSHTAGRKCGLLLPRSGPVITK